MDSHERYERERHRDALQRRWQLRYDQLQVDGRTIMRALDLSERTLRRYEREGAPAWFDFALVGLWNHRRVTEGKGAA